MAATAAPRRPASKRSAPARIRWDRISRYALLLVFLVLVLLYIGPTHSYFATLGESNSRADQVRKLEREHARLEARKRALADPAVVEAEARRLGMVRPGERPFVVRNLPHG
jgi:cell division protein FtsB